MIKLVSVQRTTMKPGQQPFALHEQGCRDLRKEQGYQDAIEAESIELAVARVLRVFGNEAHKAADVKVMNCAWTAEYVAKFPPGVPKAKA